MAKKAKKEGVCIEQHKDGRWLLLIDGNVILEATHKETVEHYQETLEERRQNETFLD